jgi:hypothetical protein
MAEETEGYPEDEEKRLQYWNRQIAYAEKYYEPYFKAGDVLLRIFNNVAANFREQAADSLLPDNISRIKAGIVYAWVEQSIANLQERDPFFKVSPENKYSAKGCPVVQSAMNYWYRETRQPYHDGRCLLDGFIYPWMVKKFGWNSRILDAEEVSMASLAEYSEDDPESAAMLLASGIPLKATETQDHEAHIDAVVIAMQDPFVDPDVVTSIMEPYVADHTAMLEKPQADQDVSIQYDAPFAVRWHPKRFLMSPFNEHGTLDTPWTGFKWCKPLLEVKNNSMYQNTEDLKGSARVDFAPEEQNDLLGYDDFGMVEGIEIFARNFPVRKGVRKNLRIIIARDHDKFLRYDEEWPFTNIEDYPATVATFQHDVDAWINKPILSLAGGDNLQMLINEMLDSMLSVVRKQKNVFFYDKDIFSELGDGQFEAILQAPEGSAFAIPGLAEARGAAVVAMPFNQIPDDKSSVANIMQTMFDRVLGTAEPLRSRSSPTATQAAIVERRVTAREDRRGDVFKNFQIETVKKFWQLHQQFLPDRQFLIDPRTEYWANVDEEIAKGEYRFKIDISTSAQSQAVEFDRYQKALNLAAGITPLFLQLYGAAPNIMKMFEDLLTRGLDIRDIESYLPISSDNADTALQQTMMQPGSRERLIEALVRLKGGGDMGTSGPVNPQLYASQPQTEADAFTQAQQ